MNPQLMVPLLAGRLLDWILVCLVEGTILAAAVALLLRLVPVSTQNSRTRFAVWFSALLVIAALPAFRGAWPAHDAGSTAGAALITISSTWALFIVFFWTAGALAGLIRVATGLGSLRRLRKSCVEIPSHLLGSELHSAITSFRRSRPLSILVSNQALAPGAVGFFHPAIVLPAWLVEDPSAPELKYAVLHELAHLERWDDWSNLAQKLVKAVLFFHPGVWWIERNVSLEREIACDDRVIARSGNARLYAECLARLAEKSFLRRQYALVQAVVDRMRHLSLRVASILDERRPRGMSLWKPALPMVTVFSLLCAIPVSRTPHFVGISSGSAPMLAGSASRTPSGSASAERLSGREVSLHDYATMDRATKLAQGSEVKQPVVAPALFTMPRRRQGGKQRVKLPSNMEVSEPRRTPSFTPGLTVANASGMPALITPAEASDVVLVFVSDRIVTEHQVDASGAETAAAAGGTDVIVRVNILEVRWIFPAQASSKPIPRKT